MNVIYVLLIIFFTATNNWITVYEEKYARIKISPFINKIFFFGSPRDRYAYFNQEKKKIRHIRVEKVTLFNILVQLLLNLLTVVSIFTLLFLLLDRRMYISIGGRTWWWVGNISALCAISFILIFTNIVRACIFEFVYEFICIRKLPKEDRPSSSVWFTPPQPDTPVSIYARPRLKAIADERAWKFGLQSGQEWDKEGFLHQKENDKVDSVAALMSLAYYIGDDPLQIGHTGEPVAALQSFLGLPVTGNFDEVLEASVKQVQKKLGLPETGVFDGLIIDTLISLLTRADADLTRKAEKEAGNKSPRFDRLAHDVMNMLLVAIVIGMLIASYRLP